MGAMVRAAGSKKPFTRLLAWIAVVAGLGCTLSALVWTGANVDQKTILEQIWLYSSLVMIFLSAMAWLLHTTPTSAIKLPQWVSVLIILMLTVGLRLAMMIWWVPTLSDDFFRYRRDAQMVIHGYAPYRYLPTDRSVEHPENWNLKYAKLCPYPYDLMDRMSNNAEVPTLYGPVSEMIFAGAALVDNRFTPMGRNHSTVILPPPRNTPAWYALFFNLAGNRRFWPYRAAHVLADIGIVVVLLVILSEMARSPWWAVLYACNPLALIEIAGNGHLESPGILFFMTAFLAGLKKRWIAAAVLLALALMVKVYAIIAVPVFVLWYLRENPVENWRTGVKALCRPGAAYTLTTLACLVPFITGLPDLYRTMCLYAQNWEFNGFFFHLLRWVAFMGNTGPVRPILAVFWWAGLTALLLVGWRGGWSAAKLMGHVLMLYLILMPQVYPWYVLWPLALLPLAWNAGTWAFSWTVLLSYQVWMIYRVTGQWRMSEWVFLVEWIPVVVLEVDQWRRDGGWKLLRRKVEMSPDDTHLV